MSLNFLSSFGSGIAQAKTSADDRKQREKEIALQDRYLDVLGAQKSEVAPIAPAAGPAPAAGGDVQPVSMSWQGAGYGHMPRGGFSSPNGDLLSLIDAKEGGGRYDTLFGHSQNGGKFDNVDVTKMTLDQVYDFASPKGEYGNWVKGQVGRVATPMGRYQIVGSTLKSAAAELGLAPDILFDAKTQDMIAGHLASRRLASASSPAAKRAAMRAEWEGFKSVSDEALDRAIAQYEANGGALAARPLGAVKPGA